MTTMNGQTVWEFVDTFWEQAALPALAEYISIPNKSPAFDPDWKRNGHMDRATEHFARWARQNSPEGTIVEVIQLEGRTPLLFIDIPGDSSQSILLYGHLDKQPEMTGWAENMGPWTPVRKGDRLYGRGAADDGYAMFAAIGALRVIRAEKMPHARCVIVIESCEESGSFDLPVYIEYLAHRIGRPSLVIVLDSGCANYDQLWCTTSLRGLVGGILRIDVLTEGVHSGDAGGLVPESFRIARLLLNRLEDPESGEILCSEFTVPIPPLREKQAQEAAAELGDSIYTRLPLVAGVRPLTFDLAQLILNRTWRPSLAITGADGLPPIGSAGNVLRPMTALKLSLRLPPTCDANRARDVLKSLLEENPPYGARVSFAPDWAAGGWHAKELPPWLENALDEASKTYFGKPARFMGEGGTIPFVTMLAEKFPEAHFLVTGVLGPHANAHGPNEFLHIPTAKRLTCCVAQVIAEHFRHS